MAASSGRLAAIDCMRGFVMIFMALDHVRVALFPNWDVTSVAGSSVAGFLTRWVTHFCAPVFVFLAGVGVALVAQRAVRSDQVTRYLLSRGGWLIALDLFLFNQRPTSLSFGLGVLWAIGCAFLFLAVIHRLPRVVILGVGLAILLLHNLTDSWDPAAFGPLETVWRVLHVEGRAAVGDAIILSVNYPVLPWMGLAALGYATAPLWTVGERSRQTLLGVGALVTLAFLLVRGFNAFGDPHPWMPGATWIETTKSFLSVEKYPPSLSYLCMTMGPALMMWGLLENRRPNGTGFVEVFGRVPMFFYILHLVVLHGISALGGASPGPVSSEFWTFVAVYAAWIALCAATYPLCRWYGNLKARRRAWWMRFI